MDKLIRIAGSLKTIFVTVTETGFALVGFAVLIYLLLGEKSGDFVISVLANISVLVNVLTPNVLIGAAIVLAMTMLLKRRP